MTSKVDILHDLKESLNLVRNGIASVEEASDHLEDLKDILHNVYEDMAPDATKIDTIKTILDDLVDFKDSLASFIKSLPDMPEKVKMESFILQDDLYNILMETKGMLGHEGRQDL